MPPEIDAVVQAMRCDLGLGRVDDLELENGHRGQGLRPGQDIQPAVKGALTARPRNPIPAASRWREAIQNGLFDDDDAEMVKGLDRIGGGRLHALNAAPPIPTVVSANSNYTHRPAQGQGVSKATTNHRYTPQSAVPRTSAELMKPPLKAPKTRPPPPVVAPPAQLPPQKPPCPDPEPAKYCFRVEVGVADRHAQGKGVVFLVEGTATEEDMLYVYLEGAVYLDYPLSRMFNYLTSDTQLCPQFREADGVSITTTGLQFESQAKMADFIKAVKTLRAKKSTAPPAAARVAKNDAPAPAKKSPAQAPVQKTPAPAPVQETSAPVPVKKTSAPAPIKKTPAASVPATPKARSDTVTAQANKTKTPAEAPAAAQKVSASTDVSDLVDLVDLSQPADSSVPNQFTRSSRVSTYAMDLESLCSSPTQPTSESSSSGRDDDTHGFRFIPFPSTLSFKAAEPESQKKDPVPGPGPLPKPEASQASSNNPGRPQDMLDSCLRTILPAFETLDEILGVFDEDERFDVLKTSVTRVQEEQGGRNETCRESAKLLLQALATEQPISSVADTARTQPIPGPRYEADEMLRLRQQASTPPQLPLRLKEIAQATNQSLQGTPQDERRGSMLRPEAEEFQSSTTDGSAAAEKKPPAPPNKGLQSSRWATPDDDSSSAKPYNFTGIPPLL